MVKKKQPMKTGEKVLFTIFGVFMVFAVIAFGIMEYIRAHSDKPMYAQLTHYEFSKEGNHGSELFRVNMCRSCHRALGSGTNMGRGADLDGIGSRHDVKWIYAFLRHPEKTYGARTIDHGPAPKEASYTMKLPAKDLHAIARFLSELRSEQGSSTSPIPPKGKSVFIDTMVNTWAPKEWKKKYKDIRDNPEALKRAARDAERKGL